MTAAIPTFLSVNPLHFLHFSVLYFLLFHQQSVLLHHKLGLLLKLLPIEENGAREAPHCQSDEPATTCSTLPWQCASLSVAAPPPPHPEEKQAVGTARHKLTMCAKENATQFLASLEVYKLFTIVSYHSSGPRASGLDLLTLCNQQQKETRMRDWKAVVLFVLRMIEVRRGWSKRAHPQPYDRRIWSYVVRV